MLPRQCMLLKAHITSSKPKMPNQHLLSHLRKAAALVKDASGNRGLGLGQSQCSKQASPMVQQEAKSGMHLSERHGRAGMRALLHQGPGGRALSASFGIASCVCLGGLSALSGQEVAAWRVMVPFAEIWRFQNLALIRTGVMCNVLKFSS